MKCSDLVLLVSWFCSMISLISFFNITSYIRFFFRIAAVSSLLRVFALLYHVSLFCPSSSFRAASDVFRCSCKNSTCSLTSSLPFLWHPFFSRSLIFSLHKILPDIITNIPVPSLSFLPSHPPEPHPTHRSHALLLRLNLL